MNEPATQPTPVTPPTPDEEAKPTTLQVRLRTWVILGVSVLLIGATVILIDQSPSWGNNGFPTESEDLTAEWLVRGGARDLVPALTDPTLLTVEEAKAIKLGRKAMMFDTDRVYGVVHNGEAVCIPTRVLNWHEVVNLTLGGTPIALTFSPLGDAPRAYERGEHEFGHSGLLYCSNPLLYDSGKTPSLWSQLDGKARSGPLRGTALPRIPVELAQWGDWIARYPETRMVRPEVEVRGKFYRLNSYGPYLRSDEVRFPAPAAPPGLSAKERVVVVEAGGLRLAYPVTRVIAELGLAGEATPGKMREGRWAVEQGGQTVTFVVHLDASEADPASIRVLAPARIESEGLWFALAAFDPELKLAPTSP